jgi:coenzyme Q-binding protein COQ10
MFTHKEQQILPYPIEHVYAVVANVEAYPSFIQWVTSVKVLEQQGNKILYEIGVGFKGLSTSFVTEDVFELNKSIEISLVKSNKISSPFKSLYNVWHFDKIDDNTTLVHFHIDFDFKSMILGKMFSGVFLLAQQKIFQSFHNRAEHTYNKN